ncbi:MAG: formate dehydrogenase accessory sulfurtransferase FdhD, partial [Candidatus Delongbacteria bacterium]|nr:formate dehydrogenase accessory sulfurtransferase FdhD [Candidatus Delongbacteria bacterium]MCG2760352.1 formate dehydrogenase accessory sulfurtransferase FdhD [Candidatus Delongbacteria bacterium]
MEVSSKKLILKYKNGLKSEIYDEIVNEIVLNLAINFKNISSLTCSPECLKELTAGYLLTSGIITETNKLVDLKFEESKNIMHIELEDNSIVKDMIFSKLKPVGCGAGNLLFAKRDLKNIFEHKISITNEQISNLMAEFNKSSELFLATGGVHSAAISNGKSVLVMREDIGRHNAIDKVIGNIYLANDSLSDKIILTSGRLSSEIVMKAIYSGIQMIISRSAPTIRAIELAEENGITLIGFARS